MVGLHEPEALADFTQSRSHDRRYASSTTQLRARVAREICTAGEEISWGITFSPSSRSAALLHTMSWRKAHQILGLMSEDGPRPHLPHA